MRALVSESQVDLQHLVSTAVLASAVVLALALALPAWGDTFTVDSTGEAGDANAGDGSCNDGSGYCTLLAAIQEVNAYATGAPHTIAFSVSSFQLTDELPQITRLGTVIDGWSHPSHVAGGPPVVVLSGESASNSRGLRIGGNNITVQGLQIHSFIYSGIVIEVGTTGALVRGCYIGTNGVTDLGNGGDGVTIMTANANTVGGDSAAARNVISGNTGAGIMVLSGAAGNTVIGNYIGTNAAGTGAVPNGGGVWVIQDATNTTIGGATAGQGNVISGNTGTGITISSNSWAGVVLGNLIGVTASGFGALGNGSHGIEIQATPDVLIGGTFSGEPNTIAYNGGDGISIFNPPCILKHISSNSIHDNAGLGIDLGNDGVTLNDPGDPDTGPNNLQNFPVLTSVTSGSGQTEISGMLNSAANQNFRLEFFASQFCDPSGYGEGAVYLGSLDNVLTDGSGNAAFTATLTGNVNPGWAITATTTDGSGNTSEFSACALLAGSAEPIPALSPMALAALALLLAALAVIALKGRLS